MRCSTNWVLKILLPVPHLSFIDYDLKSTLFKKACQTFPDFSSLDIFGQGGTRRESIKKIKAPNPLRRKIRLLNPLFGTDNPKQIIPMAQPWRGQGEIILAKRLLEREIP